ncbi:DUF1800 family protein [Aquincola sp. MAHUQ-54]|uniref:DUF1800 family protein n=1 Tax=Aquincola agrisoli TaxID=3119538 RepID=A0AAW9QBP4_9BURK
MTHSLIQTLRLASAGLLISLLAACGGGGSIEPSAADTPGTTATARILASGAVGRDSTALTVRAHATMSNNIGPTMQVWLDGALVGSAEVRATEPTDYQFSVSSLRPGSKLDIAYINNTIDTANGADRNLFVEQVSAGTTAVIPSATTATVDRGVGAAAFDGIDVQPGGTGLFWDGALRLTWPQANLTDRITVRASGTSSGAAPRMVVRVDDVVVGTADVTSATPADYSFAAPKFGPGSKVDVAFVNAGTVAGVTRLLNVHYLLAGATVLRPTDRGVFFDAGIGLAAYDWANQSAASASLSNNGALRGVWPASNMSDTLTLRVSSTWLADNVAPVLEVVADGVVLGVFEVRSTAPTDISMPTLPLKAGQRIEVRNTNEVAGRAALVSYLISGKTVLQPTSSVGNLSAYWPEPNLTDSLNVRARADLAGGVGALMQLYVDGVMVGATEVKSTVFADYRFAVPPMGQGRKVDVVFANPESPVGEDRNLFVAYLTTSNTVMLPGQTGNVYDRGVAAAAFDGKDTLIGTGNLYWGGSLRMNWPAPNLTETVTVRASATPAGGVGAFMLLWVDGVAVSSVEVKSTTPVDYAMPTTAIKPGSKVAVVFSNPGTVDGVERTLNVQYAINGSTLITPSSANVSHASGELSAVWPQPNINDTLTIRAYADIAGGMGAQMQVWIDDVLAATQEVRSTTPEDFAIRVPTIKPGSRIDVVYVNNTVNTGGGDRNLHVLQLTRGATAVVPGPTTATVDRGVGAAAFDGIDVQPGGTGLFWDGALRLTWPQANLTDRITVRASGTSSGAAPRMVVRVDDVVVGTADVTSATPADYSFAAPKFGPGSKVDVAFVNAGTVAGVTRLLNVHYLLAGATVLRPTDRGVFFDAGIGLAAYDWANQSAASASLSNNGALRGVWPASNMSDTLTLRVSSTWLADNVAPVLEVVADGVVLGVFEVRSTAPTDISMPTLPLKAGQRIEVRNTNEVAGRAALVSYLISGKTVLQPTSSVGNLSAYWPEPNLTDSLNVRARADLAGGVGALMQLYVDGVMVGATEVKSTVFADYRFAVPPMGQGRKVDVVFANNDSPAGEDHNLFVAYLTTSNTVMLPGQTGNVYDRGVAAAAFDGKDTLIGTGNLYWGGSLRMNWPAPNLTETVTVRASATPAGGVGAFMLLWVDGVAVSSVEVKSTTPVDYAMPTTAIKPGSKVAVVFSNRGTVDGVERTLNVQYAISGQTFITPSSPGVVYASGDLSAVWPTSNINDILTIRAYADVAGGVGAQVEVRINGVLVASREVTATTPTDYQVRVPTIRPSDKIDIVFTNDAQVGGADRNLYVVHVRSGNWVLASSATGTLFDAGNGAAATDGNQASPTTGAAYVNGALRFTISDVTGAGSSATQNAAARFLQQASFGATAAEIDKVLSMGRAAWIDEQMAYPFVPEYVNHIEKKFSLGTAYRPTGSQYSPLWIGQKFWKAATTSPDQLRRRMAFALHEILMVSQADSTVYQHARGYANYVDTLHKHAFGNYRNLLEDIALSPMMGLYLSHMRNRPEDISLGRMPDENFAREIMQLFTIGLHELNIDGTPVVDGMGQAVETYSNNDVMALSKVFTGWSWAFKDAQLNESNFRWGLPTLTDPALDEKIDLKRMKPYPGMHSLVEKRLFATKPWATVLPAGNSADADMQAALNVLFNHPNVGPFIGRQLIQRLVTSHPTPGYVARIARVFNDNGKGVRGDLGAVARAILLDSEATSPPEGSITKLKEPVLAVTQWLRATGAQSASGDYLINYDLDAMAQRPWHSPSVFNYFRPGYIPPNTSLSSTNATVPELQIVDEATTARWVNLAFNMAGGGLGWANGIRDVTANLKPLATISEAGRPDLLIEQLNLILHAGRMQSALKAEIMDAMSAVQGNDSASHTNRARIALFLALATPDYLIQR